MGSSCDKGVCQERVSKNGKEVVEVCKFKPTIKQVEENTQDSQSCHYYLQKYDALVSKHSLWNYHAFFTIMKFNKKLFEDYLDRKVTVLMRLIKLRIKLFNLLDLISLVVK